VKFTKIKEEGNESLFLVEGVTPAFINSLRRACMSEVPVMAIDEIEIIENKSAMYDEILAHRLGLIPLNTDLDYNLKERCKCGGKGCSRCEVRLKLDVEGPRIVYAKDLKSDDPKITPVYPEIPIVELLEGQKVDLVAIARLGFGKEHVKFSPCLAIHRNFPSIKIDVKKCNGCNACINVCPKHILVERDKKVAIDTEKLMECDLCLACVDACKENAIEVYGEEDKYLLYIESWGQLSVGQILKSAIQNLVKKLREFKRAAKL